MMKSFCSSCWIILGCLLLKGCGGSFFTDEDQAMRDRAKMLSESVNADGTKKPAWMQSVGDGVYKVGKPYKVNGVWYFPKEDYKYDEIGIASWYGPGFHQKTTANGEVFDMGLITAAHKTLPLPSVVRVTNLENGRTLLVRVNDRGPFVNDRILDLSNKGAELLGFLPKGTAKVRVELLHEESMTVASLVQNKAYMKENEQTDTSQGKAAAGVVSFTMEGAAAKPALKSEAPALSQGAESPQGFSSMGKDEESLDSIVQGLSDHKKGVQVAPSKSSKPKASVPKSSATPVPVGAGNIYLQVGAFGNADNAKRLAVSLASVGQQPTVQPFKAGGKSLYRVRFGPFEDAASAQKVENAIAKTGHDDVKMMMD